MAKLILREEKETLAQDHRVGAKGIIGAGVFIKHSKPRS